MKDATNQPQPPEPLGEHERSLMLEKSQPPEPAWAYYLLALGTVIGGIVMGVIYLVKDNAQSRAFGVRALLASFVLPIVIVAGVLLFRATQVERSVPVQEPGVLLPE